MKKLIITLAIILGMGMTSFAQDETFGGGGLLQRGDTPHYDFYADWADLGWTRTTSGLFNLPGGHGLTTDAAAPLGTGIAILAALGGAYLVTKRRKEE